MNLMGCVIAFFQDISKLFKLTNGIKFNYIKQ